MLTRRWGIGCSHQGPIVLEPCACRGSHCCPRVQTQGVPGGKDLGQVRGEPMSWGVFLVVGPLAFLGWWFWWWTYWVNGSPFGGWAVLQMC